MRNRSLGERGRRGKMMEYHHCRCREWMQQCGFPLPRTNDVSYIELRRPSRSNYWVPSRPGHTAHLRCPTRYYNSNWRRRKTDLRTTSTREGRRQPNMRCSQDERRAEEKTTESTCATSCSNPKQVSDHDGYKKKMVSCIPQHILFSILTPTNRKVLVQKKDEGNKSMKCRTY